MLKVTLPAIAPGIFLGVRIGAPIALVVTLLVEFLTQVDGIGAPDRDGAAQLPLG